MMTDPIQAQTDARERAIAIEAAGGMEKPHAVPATAGQDSKFTDKYKGPILGALSRNHFLPAAAALAGVGVDTVYGWIRRGNIDRNNGVDSDYAEFAMNVDRAIAAGEATALKTVQKAVEQGNVTAATWLLERRHGDRGWRKTDKVEVAGDPSAPVVVQLTWPGAPTQQAIQNQAAIEGEVIEDAVIVDDGQAAG